MKYFYAIFLAIPIFLFNSEVLAEEPFKFKSTKKIAVDLIVLSNEGAPIPFARIHIGTAYTKAKRRALLRQSQNSRVFFTGITNRNGELQDYEITNSQFA